MYRVPKGRFTVMRNGFRMESIYIPCQGAERLLVILGGARQWGADKTLKPLPNFSMWSWCVRLKMNYLFIEDPMYYMFQDPPLMLGWYYGTRETDLRDYIADLIKRIADLEGFSRSSIKLYGISGGGSTSIAVASRIGGCCAIANNPQINFPEYHYSETFAKITGIDFTDECSDGGRNDLLEMTDRSDSKVLVMINAYSIEDTSLHLKLMTKRYDFVPRLGLNRVSDNIVLWLYAAPGAPQPHTTTPTDSVFHALFWLTDMMLENRDTEPLQSLFLLMSNITYNDWDTKRVMYNSELAHKEQLEVIKKEARTASKNELLETLHTARFDIKNSGPEGSDLELVSISDSDAEITRPGWFVKNGGGCIIHSSAGSLDLEMICRNDGELLMTLRGKYVKDADGSNLPVWIDYQKLSVNGKNVIEKPTAICHDYNFKYRIPVRDGETLDIHVEWTTHKKVR